MGGFSTLRLSWEQIKQKLENEGAKNKAYDSDVDGVFDLTAIPTITRDKLEYPTEGVSLAYLDAINKTTMGFYGAVIGLLTADSFTDKKILGAVNSDDNIDAATARWSSGANNYHNRIMPSNSTSDHDIVKTVDGSDTIIASESVDLSARANWYVYLQVSGSEIKSGRSEANPTADLFSVTFTTISVTDTELASGKYGFSIFKELISQGSGFSYLQAPTSPKPPALSIIEAEITNVGDIVKSFKPNILQNFKKVSSLTGLPDFLYQEAKKHEILKANGFTDEEIKLLLGNIQTHVDLASVTWGAFDHKPEHNTMLITITSGNPYTGEKAIQEQVEHAKSKNLKVLKPPRDYSEAIEQYKQLKQEFTEWIAGKDNFAYQTLGHEDFEKFQVADTYHGNIVEGYRPNAYKNVPDWEIRRALAMWKERLKRATVVKTEAEKHLKKLEEVEKKGW